MGIYHRLCILVSIIRFYPELKCYFFSCWMNLLMNGQTRLSKVCVPLHVAQISVDFAWHACFRDGHACLEQAESSFLL